MNQNLETAVERLVNRQGADWTKPPENYTEFIKQTLEIVIRKDTDYNSRFMRGLHELDPYTIWAWEVDKKLDRIRTWIKRGELQVKGEGIRNSVDDLFNYTVQYDLFNTGVTLEEWKENKRALFQERTEHHSIAAWVSLLIYDGRIQEDELLLQLIIRQYMGDDIHPVDWKEAIRALLR